MKTIKFFAVATLLAISSGAYAQFTNTPSNASVSTVNSDGWSSVWVEYNPVTAKIDISGADNESMTGFSAGFSKAFSITPGTPLFVEAGLGAMYVNKKEFQDIDDFDFTMFSFKVPVNLAYKFDLNNSPVSIIPFVGATARYNLSGKFKYSGGSKDKEFDVFEKKDMEDLGLLDGKAWNRLQFGWQIGLKAMISSNFLVGVSYGSDFSEIAKKVTMSTTSIGIAYAF